jgi:hypothetical protein
MRTILAIVALATAVTVGAPVKSNLGAYSIDFTRSAEVLPDGAVAVEYLECTGTQYIDLGIYPCWDDIVDMGFVNTANSTGWSQGIGFAITSSDNMKFFGLMVRAYPNRPGYIYINGMHNSSGGAISLYLQGTLGAYQHLHIENGESYLDSATLTTTWSEYPPCDLSLCLFARHYIDTTGTERINSSYCKGSKLRTFSITRGGVKIIDLVACRIEDVGYMYDRVSGEFLGNQGSGDFIVGGDL